MQPCGAGTKDRRIPTILQEGVCHADVWIYANDSEHSICRAKPLSDYIMCSHNMEKDTISSELVDEWLINPCPPGLENSVSVQEKQRPLLYRLSGVTLPVTWLLTRCAIATMEAKGQLNLARIPDVASPLLPVTGGPTIAKPTPSPPAPQQRSIFQQKHIPAARHPTLI